MSNKLWPDAIVYPAPPVKDRPRCRACGKRLRPNYEVDRESREIERGPETYSKHETRIIRRVWDGSYGLNERFCGPNCACDWALSVCLALDEKGEHWRCAKAIEYEKRDARGI